MAGGKGSEVTTETGMGGEVGGGEDEEEEEEEDNCPTCREELNLEDVPACACSGDEVEGSL